MSTNQLSISTPPYKNKGLAVCLLASISLLSVMNEAEGAVIITGQEVGNNVVFSHTGSIDLEGAGFTFDQDGSFQSYFYR
ncbi:MAG: hypothetical protein IGQ45_10815 [Cyanobacterium sp. T60_A2020_053]|nr:hypothetical protein [Cyanobacterium sp. T60_A2020_053]